MNSQITIKTCDNPEGENVKAVLISKDIAVNLDPNGKVFNVTHLPTGRALMRFQDVDKAILISREMLEKFRGLLNFKRLEDIREEARDSLRNFCLLNSDYHYYLLNGTLFELEEIKWITKCTDEQGEEKVLASCLWWGWDWINVAQIKIGYQSTNR